MPHVKGNFEEKGCPIVKYRDALSCICTKTAEPIEMPFGIWTLVGPRKHVLDVGPGRPKEGAINF